MLQLQETSLTRNCVWGRDLWKQSSVLQGSAITRTCNDVAACLITELSFTQFHNCLTEQRMQWLSSHPTVLLGHTMKHPPVFTALDCKQDQNGHQDECVTLTSCGVFDPRCDFVTLSQTSCFAALNLRHKQQRQTPEQHERKVTAPAWPVWCS